ncbi:hypothetical protein BUALT_Bualt11G0091600 [Buddleja alternifolia]|uniref:DUF8040 domain-containing protein n=1 Tax=Buddleja alternifolia TaxID=168488 RepID=A0AAV6WYG1_9LAMI|nr:hypothetical protein BUALT_Bualt11G0091600 [Buddleja alternifolia]
MDMSTFARLCYLLHNVGGLSDSKYVRVKEKVCFFLSVLAHHKKNMTVKFDHVQSGHTGCLGALDGTYINVQTPLAHKPRYRNCKCGISVNRWTVFRSTTFYPLCTQNRMILTCALLHNFIRLEMEVDPTEAQIHEDHREFYNDDHSAEVEYVATVNPSNEWSVWRDNLAGEMFNEWCGGR